MDFTLNQLTKISITTSANKVLYEMSYIFQMWIQIQINIRYMHLTSPQLCNVGVDVICWLLSHLIVHTSLDGFVAVVLFHISFTDSSIKTMIVLVCLFERPTDSCIFHWHRAKIETVATQLWFAILWFYEGHFLKHQMNN